MKRARVLVVFGTRPEAIKMAPVVLALRREKTLDVRVCATAQHRQMLDQVLEIFALRPDVDLDVMTPGQDLTELTRSVLAGMRGVLERLRPARVLVHGDTTTTLAASLASFYARVPVAHVEAGLRSGDIFSPWPEEVNRRVADSVADLFFSPTEGARRNLLAEGVPAKRVVVTGNTVVDALLMVVRRLEREPELRETVDASLPALDPSKRMLLVTGHRRESFGPGFLRICRSLARLARRGDVEIVYPVHLNPNVQAPVHRHLGRLANVHLVPPVDYLRFVRLMSRCHLILTDSGGVQEEAPSLGKPTLVLRDVTERPEAIHAGTAKLVGTDVERVVGEATRLLDDARAYRRMSRRANPFGDGRAAERIAKTLVRRHAR